MYTTQNNTNIDRYMYRMHLFIGIILENHELSRGLFPLDIILTLFLKRKNVSR